MTLQKGTEVNDLHAIYEDRYMDFKDFTRTVDDFVTEDKAITNARPKPIYTSKRRVKTWDSLKAKIETSRKIINKDNFLNSISDIAGVRIVLLHKQQIFLLHDIIEENLRRGRWSYREKPVAYESDISMESKFEEKGFKIERKESYYTSAHYLLQQRGDNSICCELQIRTMFEEIWGEIDHFVTYKPASKDLHELGKQDMRVLAHIINSGLALLDNVFKRYEN